MSGALSLAVVAALGGIHDFLDPYYLRVFGVPLMLLLGVTGALGLFIHFIVMVCRDCTDTNQVRPVYKRERPARVINMDDFEGGEPR
jgi:hypothetical protein